MVELVLELPPTMPSPPRPLRTATRAILAISMLPLLCQCGKKSHEVDGRVPAVAPDALPAVSSRPLAPVAKSDSGGSQFEKLSSQQNGIDFVHHWEPQSL